MTGTVMRTRLPHPPARAIAVALALTAIAARPQPEGESPVIVVLAAAGTIMELSQLFVAVPQATRLATLRGEQVATSEWPEMSDDVRLKLAGRVDEVAKLPEVAGVVITHDAATIKATANFLTRIVKTKKPVVLTVTSTEPAAEGRLNFYNAVAVAANQGAAGRGVLLVRDSAIHATTSPSSSPIGTVDGGTVAFHRR